MGNDVLIAFQDAAIELKKEADLNVKKFEDEELELTKKREVVTKKIFNDLAIDFDKRVQKTRNLYDLKDNQLLAYAEDVNGRREYTIKVKDIKTGAETMVWSYKNEDEEIEQQKNSNNSLISTIEGQSEFQ